MKTIPLTQGLEALVDDEDYGFLSRYNWCAHNPRGGLYYAVRRDDESGRIIKMHQVLLGPKEGYEIDHEDGNGLNNQRNNLRFLTHSQNLMNYPKPKGIHSSKYKGVSLDRYGRGWSAYVNKNGKRFRLGYFPTEESAARAYDFKAMELYGTDIPRLNLPDSKSLFQQMSNNQAITSKVMP